MDGTWPETCAECGFDARSWRPRDAATLLAALGWWWRTALDGIDATELNRRPAPGVWSALEYGFHTAAVTAVIRRGLEVVLAADGVDLPAPPASGGGPGEPAVFHVDEVLAAIETEGGALADLVKGSDSGAWARTGRLPDGSIVQAEAVLLHAAHDAAHHQMDVARGLAAIGAGTPHQRGSVMRVNASSGGVPKRSIGQATVTADGLDGDVQADRKHHGRPFQALCLWSADVIHEIAAHGHPIEAGSAGENLTLTGIDWSTIRPGSLVEVGSALAEVSFVAVPCAKQSRWFTDGDFNHIAHDRNPGWVRWYAWVRRPGEVREGDAAVVQP